MKKIISYVAIASLAVVSCTKTDVDIAPGHSSIMSIPLMVENEGIDNSDADADTKSYLQDNGSTWSFVWEDGDQLGYFQLRDGDVYDQYSAEVDKRPSSVTVNYPMDNIRANDVLYTYLSSAEASASTDPTALEVVIPVYQITSDDAEMYTYQEDFSFSISSVRLNSTSATLSLGSSESAIGKVPPTRTLSFKIVGYNPELTYCVGGAASNLVVRADGRATATVEFPAITEDDLISSATFKNTYKVESEVLIYVEGHAEAAATVNAAVTAVEQLPSAVILTSYKKVTYTYALSGSYTASVIFDIIEYGEQKPYPVRDCMPIVSKQFYVSSNYIQYPEDIQNNMTMYMLGSVIEFRVYTTDDSIGIGETLYGVEFLSGNGQYCAGTATYDLLGESLTATGYNASGILSMDYNGKAIANGKTNYVSIYMVVAPGTYPATVNFITDQKVYTVNMSSKTFSRAVRKALNVNLATAPASTIAIEDYVPSV